MHSLFTTLFDPKSALFAAALALFGLSASSANASLILTIDPANNLLKLDGSDSGTPGNLAPGGFGSSAVDGVEWSFGLGAPASAGTGATLGSLSGGNDVLATEVSDDGAGTGFHIGLGNDTALFPAGTPDTITGDGVWVPYAFFASWDLIADIVDPGAVGASVTASPVTGTGWSDLTVTVVRPGPAVPDSGSTALLLGLGMIGLMRAKRLVAS